ncbi:hypothetical protein GCM10023149_32220 [Mucilaginibacter gynuensis]|uniref:Glycosyl transferase family 2 n=1 Tax=Mucilaginibacter gynuensis TaxID=1302236 RepID=A0ABP8GPY3_9SPHI
MIALVTSTLSPNGAYTHFTPQQRLEQTLVTISKLQGVGFQQIYLFDNSVDDSVYRIKTHFPEVHISHQQQYTFANKGLNEALLILNNLHQLPAGVPIFKISGRYYPVAGFDKNIWLSNAGKDIIGFGTDFNKAVANFSTRAYFIKDKALLEDILVLAIEDMLAYSKGVYGLRSFLNMLQSLFKPHLGSRYQLSLEQAFARIIRQKYNYHLVNRLYIEGYVAGARHLDLITE